jgi:hypothetical protein
VDTRLRAIRGDGPCDSIAEHLGGESAKSAKSELTSDDSNQVMSQFDSTVPIPNLEAADGSLSRLVLRVT